MSPGDRDVGVGVTVGVAGGTGVAVVLRGDSGGHGSGDELGSVTIAVVMFCCVDRADLASHLFVDWLADLPADWMTFLHRGLDRDSDGDRAAALSGDGNTGGLRDLADHSVTHSHGLGVTHSLGNFFLHYLAVLSGHGSALGDGDTLGDCDAVRCDHLLGDWGADRDLHTVWD